MKTLKLKKFDASAAGQRTGKPFVSFGNKGLIGFTKPAGELIKLKDGDCISFFQDEEDPADWYVAKDKEGLKIRQNTSGGYALNASVVCNNVMTSLGKEPGSYSFPLGAEPTILDKKELWPIITLKQK
jgi:hypothetical protein